MAEQTTRPYRRTLSGSVGAGMGSLFRPGGRKYYILEHKVSSRYHRAGESQEIIVDSIELGRDSRCQVRFDESFKTVSRRHAAIVREGDGWKLVQLSKTNTTLLNGHPVQTEWYLQNGDEIQLSVNGPKLGFIVPTGRKATVGSIGLTRRLSLFRQQALRPYKAAISALAAVLVVCAGVGGYIIFRQHQQIQDNSKLLAEARAANEKNAKLIAEQNKIINNQGGLLDSLRNSIPAAVTAPTPPPAAAPATPAAPAAPAASGGAAAPAEGGPGLDFTAYHPHIYFIQAQVVSKESDEIISEWSGTGFLLNDGKFVSARHVLTPFYSNTYRIRDGNVELASQSARDSIIAYLEMWANILYVKGQADIVFKCTSVSGSFTFTSSYDDNPVISDGSGDQIYTLQESYVIKIKNKNGETRVEVPAGSQIVEGGMGYLDFAYVETNLNGGLEADRELSVNLKQGTQLSIVGYPNGWGQGNPILSTALCAQNGLSEELGNTIMVSNNNTEGGNSGGPVFAQKDGRWVVVAIVSGRNNQKGRFVPIAVIP